MHVTAFASGYTFTAHYFIMAYFAKMGEICHIVCYACILKAEKGPKLYYNRAKIIFILH